MFKRFSAGEQFDREQILGKIDNRPQFERAGHAHRHVVLFATRRGHVVDAGGMCKHTRFV